MTCDSNCNLITIGDTCEGQINYGETLDILFFYKDSQGNPVDLSGATASIFNSSPEVIKDHAVVTITDPVAGEIQLLLSRDFSQGLRKGMNNRFRLQVIFGPDSDDITPDIWIKIT